MDSPANAGLGAFIDRFTQCVIHAGEREHRRVATAGPQPIHLPLETGLPRRDAGRADGGLGRDDGESGAAITAFAGGP